MKLKVAHTPDADDAFMFYGMTEGKIKANFEIEHVIEDIETLNRMAFSWELDVTALSVHAYAYLYDKYRILSSGASVGDGYGPILVSRENIDPENSTIAIPGKYTSAYLYLKLAVDNFSAVEMRFDEIIKAVKNGKVDAGLLIHEGQLTYRKQGLVKILDLWEWWHGITKLPMPLGVNAISRKIPENIQKEFLDIMKRSISYALKNPDEATSYAMKYSRGMDFEETKKFAMMYVNNYTYSMPESVVNAIETLFNMAEEKGILKKPPIDILY